MRAAAYSTTLPSVFQSEVEYRFQLALDYYRERQAVIFLSYCRFWEPHVFVQQSLAKYLVENEIEVHWFDGLSGRSYTPTQYFQSPLLNVQSLFQFPGERFPTIKKANRLFKTAAILNTVKKLGNPIIWVQAGLDEEISESLPYVDVFSTFDDPYRHEPTGNLCKKAQLILCQNSYALSLMDKVHSEKAVKVLPPVELPPLLSDVSMAKLPSNFPKQTMGYVGSFFSYDYDLILFENIMKSLPDWGFILMGRTDPDGEEYMGSLTRYPNFFRFPWVPRSHAQLAWRLLDVSLLLYRPCREQNGAFPVKVLESLQFGVPLVATKVPKTADLEPYFPRSPFSDQLQRFACEQSRRNPQEIQSAFSHFSREMDPRLHLARVAEILKGASI